MKFSRLLATVALPVVVAGCTTFPGVTWELDELKATQPTGTPFTQALSREYQAFAEAQRAEFDWFNSQHFARKGLAAAHGTVVAPEEPGAWSISDKAAAQDLAAAHARLTGVLQSNAPRRVPALTATAQVKYDCWVEEQDEGWETNAIEACRKDFMAAMSAIETQAKPAAPAPAPAAVAPRNQFMTFFDFNQDRLTPEGSRIIAEAAKAAKAANYPTLTVVGYTDSVGSDTYNMRLSYRRAEVVRKALIAAGVPADRVVAEGRGKQDQLVRTADGVREPQNRRAVIRFPG